MNKYIIIISSLLVPFVKYEPERISDLYSKNAPCYYRDFEINNKPVLDKIITYVNSIEEEALPIVAIANKRDSSFVYITATIAANSIKNSPPSYITTIGGREVAIYTGHNALSNECLKTAVGHYRSYLQIDRSNKTNGRLPGEIVYYTYESPSVKISLVSNKIISIIDNDYAATQTPFYKFSF